ncbi:MAG: MFS transporter [Desulfovibrio sp.]|jgi:sugar phosphate permease|nr:MFS transporter [Desulfovibrio sp.]
MDRRIRAIDSRRIQLFLGITFPYLVSYFQRSAPAVVAPEIAAELSLSPSYLGVLVSMYAWGYAAAQIPAGLLSDTLGPRKTISICVLIAALGSVIFAAAPDFYLLALGRFLVGLGVGFAYVPAVRVMTEWYEPDELGTYSGLLLGIGNLGALLSAAPLAFLMGFFGWRLLFVAVAVFTLFSSYYCWLTVRDRPPRAEAPLRAAERIGLREALVSVFSNGRFSLIALLLFCYYGTLLGVGSLWLGPYLQDVYGLSKQAAGNLLMMIPLAFIFCCPLSGYLSDKVFHSRKKVLLYGAMLHILAYAPLVFMTDSLGLVQMYILFLAYGATGSAFVVNYACAKETVEQKYAGTALGSINIFLFLGGAFFQTVMGVVLEAHNMLPGGGYSSQAYSDAFAVAAAGLAAGTFFFVFFREKPA